MDRFIERFAKVDADLVISHEHGVAYQRDMTASRVAYGAEYFAKVSAYNGVIARAVNHGRCVMLERYLPRGATVLDIGAGNGAFIRAAGMSGFDAKGFDVMPEAVAELKAADCYADDPQDFDAVTLWDTIEHLEEPALCLKAMRRGAFLFASIPVFQDLGRIRESKHYRPSEHLYYWTAKGFCDWLARYGFRLLEESAHEINAGRESIGAFAFCKDGELNAV
jgi:2-polyprenyl-3-methyl-5-hydroxy-6-metoxy-1,4-benzoquinol methylase